MLYVKIVFVQFSCLFFFFYSKIIDEIPVTPEPTLKRPTSLELLPVSTVSAAFSLFIFINDHGFLCLAV